MEPQKTKTVFRQDPESGGLRKVKIPAKAPTTPNSSAADAYKKANSGGGLLAKYGKPHKTEESVEMENEIENVEVDGDFDPSEEDLQDTMAVSDMIDSALTDNAANFAKSFQDELGRRINSKIDELKYDISQSFGSEPVEDNTDSGDENPESDENNEETE